MTNEVYRITLDHFIDNDGKLSRLDEPIIVQMVYDRRYTSPAICLNSMIERMRDEVLKRAIEGADE